jgi:hypothetical protein
MSVLLYLNFGGKFEIPENNELQILYELQILPHIYFILISKNRADIIYFGEIVCNKAKNLIDVLSHDIYRLSKHCSLL